MRLSIVLGGCAFLAVIALFFFGQAQYKKIAQKCPPLGNFVKVEEDRLHYIEREGGEIPVIFLHGASSNSRDWLQSLFKHLPNYYLLVAIDRPGHGYSQRDANFTFKKQVDLLHGAIQKLKIRKPVLVVHSLSGVIGARLLSDYPQDYAGLIIIAGATYPIGDGSSWYTKLATMPVLGQFFRYAIVPAIAPVIAPGLIDKSFYPQKAASDYAEKSCLELLFAPDRFLANAEDLNQIRPFLDESYPLYAKITSPVSLIYGDQDQVIYQFSHAAGFKHKVPHAKYIMLQNTGHLPHFFHQETIRQEIDRIYAHPHISN